MGGKNEMEYAIGTEVLNGWEIVSLIGEGSFGKVYEIQKNNYGVIIKSALKVIHIPQSKSEVESIMYEGMDEKSITSYFQGVVQDIVKEITVMSELKGHANIVSCEDYSVVEYQDTMGWDILIRMELLIPLQEYVKGHTLTEKEVVKIGQDLCKALSLCQKKGLVHRDIKPANIFVNDVGEFKLGDFGIARSSDKTSGVLSKKGTESYMAPEVYLGKDYDARADFYSVGLVLYNLMNNKRLPFMPTSSTAVRFEDRENAMRKRMNGEELPTPINASQEFANIIRKMCAFEPKDRYQTADEMLSALNEIDKNTVMANREKKPEQRGAINVSTPKFEKKERSAKKSNTGAIIAGVAALFLIIVGAFVIKYFTSPQYAAKGESEELYEVAIQQMEDGEYEEAIKTFDKISKDWAKYDDAIDKRSEAVERYKERIIKDAEGFLEEEDYTSAISVLEVAMKVIGDNSIVAEEIAEINKKQIYVKVLEYKKNEDFAEAIQYINNNLDAIDDDSNIMFELSNCEQKYRESILADAVSAYTNEGYEAAITIINNGLKILEGDSILEEKKVEYKQCMPVALIELDRTKEGKCMEVGTDSSEIFTDVKGKTYSGEEVHCPDYSYMDDTEDENYVCYFLNQEYDILTGTIYRPYATLSSKLDWEKNAHIKIYGDNILLYENSDISKSTYDTISISVDVTGVRELKIVMDGIWRNTTSTTSLESNFRPKVCMAELKVQKELGAE